MKIFFFSFFFFLGGGGGSLQFKCGITFESRALAAKSKAIRRDGSIYQIDVSFSCVCPFVDHEFRHINIVKVAVDQQTTCIGRCHDEIHCL